MHYPDFYQAVEILKHLVVRRAECPGHLFYGR
jgi:hypothetical protein